MSIFFTFQGKTGVPGFLGNDGSPVSKPLLCILSTNQKKMHTAYTEKGDCTNFPNAVQLNTAHADMLLAFSAKLIENISLNVRLFFFFQW